ncbi:MAG TPA: sulfotransferase [Ktedonobacteraceae bacterium]|nr:sulfotransferase [Ktedonobacteraceae bacterium]
MVVHPADTIKVIGAGFGRTGTLSLKAALEELGFGPCYHMTEVFHHPEHVPLWVAASNGERIDWNDIFAGYSATVDWPGCAFYEELMQVYPDAKVILTTRDPEAWYESALNTIYQISRRMNQATHPTLMEHVAKRFFPGGSGIGRITQKLVWENTFHNRFEDKAYAIQIFNQHIEEVKQRVPPDKLLVYSVKEGWEPLCAFLGVDVPAGTPFPHLNERGSFAGNKIVERTRRMVVAVAIGAAALLALALFFLGKRAK